MSDENDIPQRLRDLRCGDYSRDLCDTAADEIDRLRAEVAALKAERDKERRDACRSDAYAVHGVYTPEELAKGRGWDCFKEGTEQC